MYVNNTAVPGSRFNIGKNGEPIPLSLGRIQERYSSEIEKIGKANPYAKIIPVGEYYKRTGHTPKKMQYRVANPYYQSPESIFKTAEEKYAGFKKEFSDIAAATQADIAEQLKIVQDEKSAVSKLMEDYRNMLTEEADAKREAQEEQRVALQTARANTARSTLGSNLQIQFGGGVRPFSGGSMSRRSGTGQFKRRLNIGQSNMVNI